VRIRPVHVARPPKAKAVDVTCAHPSVEAPPDAPRGAFWVAVEAAGSGAHPSAIEGLIAEGSLELDEAPGMFVYRVAHGGRRWIGLVCSVHADELAPLVPKGAPSAATPAGGPHRWQMEPVVVQCSMPEGLGDLLIADTNERPAYHFVATVGGTHSAWIIRDHSPYESALAKTSPTRVVCGAAAVLEASRTGGRVLAILTSDLSEPGELPALLAPRLGLFVARHGGPGHA